MGEERFGESITARRGNTCLSFQYSRLSVEDGETSLSYINKFKVSLGCPRKVKECTCMCVCVCVSEGGGDGLQCLQLREQGIFIRLNGLAIPCAV